MPEPSGAPAPLRAHRHTAVFGRGRDSLAATAAATFDAARDTGDALVLVSDTGDPALLDALPGRDELVASGRLRHLRTADAYPDGAAAVLLEQFDGELRRTLTDGHTGMRVVADNTAACTRGDAAFTAWLAWEQLTSRWQADNPVVGVCWFDLDVVTPAQVAPLASLHADTHGEPSPRPFRVVAGGGGVRVEGEVTAREVPLLVRLLDLAPHDDELVVDLADAGYVHHTVFPALELLAERVPRVRIVNAGEVLRRVHAAVADPDGRVVLG